MCRFIEICNSNPKMFINNHNLTLSNFFIIYKNINRFTCKFVKFDNVSPFKFEDVLNNHLGSSKLNKDIKL